MDNQRMLAGQRIVSDTEPELGLGIVLKTDASRMEVFFPATGEQRQYALKNAPLRRVRFKDGDRLKLHSGESFVVDAVEEREGLLFYRAGDKEIPEAHLSDTISFSSPEERLLAGQVDDLYAFDLRAESLGRRAAILQNPVRGFLGGRVDLLAHQMFIANEVATRPQPRVLLADEVGLGKTEATQPGVNPFLENQLVITSVAFLAGDPVRGAQAAEAGWDLLVVDEAHHLRWSATDPSVEYSLVETLASKIQSLLLLTATPQQLGPESHFARLRLLDPARYSDLERFTAEAAHYEVVAATVDRLLSGELPTPKHTQFFGAHSKRIQEWCKALQSGDESVRQPLLVALLDAFGTGRVMFRNTRAALSGFPERKALLEKIKPGKDGSAFGAKIKWLVSFLKEKPEAKVLLICKTRRLAERIHTELQAEIAVPAGLFHEGLTLIQRDRNAAFFAEPEGARLLICSEIGSEGRNFQFAHDLVLFDLPADPELLEQRIGRLDRIGQTATIQIHVPYLTGTEEEVLARWYHEGLGAFEATPHGAAAIAAMQRSDLDALCEEFEPPQLKTFLKQTTTLRAKVAVQLKHGYDRLLERSSCRMPEANQVLEAIRTADTDASFESFFLRLLDFLGIGAEP
ncbi:MAG: RNA polymerase-binding ATPase, partial [Proteobacteria bacterium]|nr:RNA polymerase-binding ATPase [Pseudomonadota bacterium]